MHIREKSVHSSIEMSCTVAHLAHAHDITLHTNSNTFIFYLTILTNKIFVNIHCI